MPGHDDERDDDEIDDASLASMRSVWLSMRDEDPPAAGMSALMAAAAAKATEMREPEPWWKRALAQLRRPPALAFATVLILIGGAVLVTRNEDTMKVEERAPELRVQEPAVEPAPIDEAIVVDDKPADAPPPLAKPRQRPVPKPKKDAVDRDSVGPNEPSRTNRFEAGSEATFGGEGDTIVTAPGIVDDRKTTAAPPPEQPRKASAPVEAPTAAPEASVKSTEALDEVPAAQLARQIEAAATRGDCAAVRTKVAQLRKQDEALYQARLAKNAAVAKCF